MGWGHNKTGAQPDGGTMGQGNNRMGAHAEMAPYHGPLSTLLLKVMIDLLSSAVDSLSSLTSSNNHRQLNSMG